MEYITEHVIEHSVELNASIFVDAFHNFSSFKPFLGLSWDNFLSFKPFLIFSSTNSYADIFMFSV